MVQLLTTQSLVLTWRSGILQASAQTCRFTIFSVARLVKVQRFIATRMVRALMKLKTMFANISSKVCSMFAPKWVATVDVSMTLSHQRVHQKVRTSILMHTCATQFVSSSTCATQSEMTLKLCTMFTSAWRQSKRCDSLRILSHTASSS